ncbi:hypothetical protein DESC_100049 [Desulfosarcina cetonica]|uniref:hypothetical protein n=1 Tax=Desulfosarcina cetonica TaxID=90730 RepID=UPI0012ED547A|nr:hypothetical protein [Desulfosarcina cetonica]VTR63853.1 hypothetical protein DESC_100049 [Desulfosarcina cetonica]
MLIKQEWCQGVRKKGDDFSTRRNVPCNGLLRRRIHKIKSDGGLRRSILNAYGCNLLQALECHRAAVKRVDPLVVGAESVPGPDPA